MGTGWGTTHGAYHPEDELYKGTEGEKGRVVPKNVYGRDDPILGGLKESPLPRPAFALPISLTLVVQVTLAYYLWRGVGEADGDLAADCASTDLYLQLAALTAFVCFAIREALDLLDVHLWLAMFPENGHPDRPLREDGSPWNGRKVSRLQNQNDRKLVRPETTIQRARDHLLLGLSAALVPRDGFTLASSGALLRSENRFDRLEHVRPVSCCSSPRACIRCSCHGLSARSRRRSHRSAGTSAVSASHYVASCPTVTRFIIIIAIVAIDVPCQPCGLDDLHTMGSGQEWHRGGALQERSFERDSVTVLQPDPFGARTSACRVLFESSGATASCCVGASEASTNLRWTHRGWNRTSRGRARVDIRRRHHRSARQPPYQRLS